MKYLLLFVIFLVLAFLWSHARTTKVAHAARKQAAKPKTITMVACAHCGMHLPTEDAVQGSHGVYCSAAHRQLRES
jgi:uncharacterized protein